jgi:hypothetical protein
VVEAQEVGVVEIRGVGLVVVVAVVAWPRVVVVDIVVVVVVVGRLMKVVEVVVPITQVASIHQVLYVQSMPRVGM